MNAELTPLDDRINVVVCQNTGAIFNIPNFCINDPLLKKEFKQKEETQEKQVKLKIMNFMKNKYYDLAVNDGLSVSDFKELLAKNEEVNLETQNIKVVCKGQLLVNERKLSDYKIVDNDYVQILISNK